MAWTTPTPITAWFTNYTKGTGTIQFTYPGDLPELSDAEADQVTGDVRKFLYAFCEKCWSKWITILVANRPTKMALQKSTYVDSTTGIVTNTFTFTFYNTITSQDVASEV
jgi:hypothetical protein